MTSWSMAELARRAGVNASTVRHYVAGGLLVSTEPGARSLLRLQFIRDARRVGFGLRQVREILSLQSSPVLPRRIVIKQADLVLEEIDARITTLNAMRHAVSVIREGGGKQEESVAVVR